MNINYINIKKFLKMEHTILAVSGKPGLYKLVSRGKANLIVEILDETHKRLPIFASDSVTSLNDIAIYTESEDVPLMNVFAYVYKKENGGTASLNYKKCSSKELREYFASVLPEFDRDRVHDSDIKKLLQWYDILVKNNMTDFDVSDEAGNGGNEKER